eukprot:TRINITY_DN2743_c0_g1_i2.p1 TRINITY_DN2743_c0_g1~~TRINITY_DN2743_c0_g1_i2.p1  ORF type:complete len:555 (-),score=169.87 TRINITY_DN2743_c0_g1_i2:406-2070(-)
MNDIAAFRAAMAAKTKSPPLSSGESSPEITVRDEGESGLQEGSLPNSMSSYEGMGNSNNQEGSEDKRAQFANMVKKRTPGPPGDLRERSLAMYKSINNMLSLVSKSDMIPLRRVLMTGAKAVGLDWAYTELSNICPATPSDLEHVYLALEAILSEEEIQKLVMPKERVEQQEREEKAHQQSEPSSEDEDSPSNSRSSLSPLTAKLKSSHGGNRSPSPFEVSPAQLSVKPQESPKMEEEEPEDTSIPYIDCAMLKNFLKEKIEDLKTKKREEPKPDNPKFLTNSQLGFQCVSFATIGSRKSMEDQCVMIPHFNQYLGLKNAPPQAYFGVYDGHSGKAAADYSKVHLHVNIFEQTVLKSEQQQTMPALESALHLGYIQTNRDFNRIASKNSLNAGTTAISVIVQPDKIIVANVGDSEAVISRDGKFHLLSYSHLPDKPEEKDRIISSGGIVVCYGTWRVNGLLSVSRSIGDNNLNKYVIADPTVTVFDRTPEDEFIVMATDGLWDVIDYQESVDFVREKLKEFPRHEIGKMLVDEAIRKKTNDNVTAVVVFFDNNS